jgi:hypothetical protein
MSIESKILDVLNKFGVEITSDIQNVLQNNRAIATGDLYRSIDYKIVQKKGEYKLVISYLDYGEFVLKGRKPGTPPPYKAILKWTQFKGIPKEAAYPIAKSIGKKGIKPLNFLFPYYSKQNQIERFLQQDVALEIEKEITLFNKK